jgi:hypothetical protein
MKIKKLDAYNRVPKEGVSNEYSTGESSFRAPFLACVIGARTAGKSYLTSQILLQAELENTYDEIYIITPTFNSNKKYFERFIPPENVFSPTKCSIATVMKKVEDNRDEYLRHLEEVEEWKKYKEKMRYRPIRSFGTSELLYYLEKGFLDDKPPEWKYRVLRPPTSLLILDDIINTKAISQSSGFLQLSVLNRHCAPMEEDHDDRSACGLGVIILAQTYASAVGTGIPRICRENVSLLFLFKNKQEKQMEKIKDELANVVDIDKFEKAYAYATAEDYGNLCVDFKPKRPELTFRKNLNEAIVFDENEKVINI